MVLTTKILVYSTEILYFSTQIKQDNSHETDSYSPFPMPHCFHSFL